MRVGHRRDSRVVQCLQLLPGTVFLAEYIILNVLSFLMLSFLQKRSSERGRREVGVVRQPLISKPFLFLFWSTVRNHLAISLPRTDPGVQNGS